MPSKVKEVERVSKDILQVRIIDHAFCTLNFRVDFRAGVIWFKDGSTFNGRWLNVETNGIKEV